MGGLIGMVSEEIFYIPSSWRGVLISHIKDREPLFSCTMMIPICFGHDAPTKAPFLPSL
jgi:hypothetical protein